MAFITAQFLIGCPKRKYSLWKVTSPAPRIFCCISAQMFYNPTNYRSTAYLERHLCEALSSTGLLKSVGDRPILNKDNNGTWSFLDNPTAARYAVPRLVYFFKIRAADQDPNFWELKGNQDGESTFEEMLEFVDGVDSVDFFPPSMASAISVKFHRDKVQIANGILNHPVHGPAPEWVFNFPPTLPPANNNYPHLRALFSALDPLLPPEARATLYTFLLGCFHSCSLSGARPVLFVDSWIQGVGKTQICQAISTLLDGQDMSISSGASRSKLYDELVAHYLTHRSAYIDNIDNRADYNNTLLATICTGEPHPRGKYDRETSALIGRVVMLNSVFGAASIHRDLVDRMARVELRGEPLPALTPLPSAYAKEHRNEIIAEILHALAASEVSGGSCVEAQSRFPEFTNAGARAASFVLGRDLGSLLEDLAAARRSAGSLESGPMAHLYKDHPERFRYVSRAVKDLVWTDYAQAPRKEIS